MKVDDVVYLRKNKGVVIKIKLQNILGVHYPIMVEFEKLDLIYYFTNEGCLSTNDFTIPTLSTTPYEVITTSEGIFLKGFTSINKGVKIIFCKECGSYIEDVQLIKGECPNCIKN